MQEILAGVLRDFSGPAKQRPKDFREMFDTFFVSKFVTQKPAFRVNLVLQKRALITFFPNAFFYPDQEPSKGGGF